VTGAAAAIIAGFEATAIEDTSTDIPGDEGSMASAVELPKPSIKYVSDETVETNWISAT
jgi:hypothetical protein